jgi:predicted nucleotidyltransferase
MSDKASGDIFSWPAPPRFSREQLLKELAQMLRGRASQAFLFGSYARETADADSDIDLILVVATEAAWPDRARSFTDLHRAFGAMDILIYTPQEWESMRSSAGLSEAAASWIEIPL